MKHITRFDPPTTPPEIDFPREERREVGAPERRTWMVYESERAGMSARAAAPEGARTAVRQDGGFQ